jgi:hypothetical protein
MMLLLPIKILPDQLPTNGMIEHLVLLGRLGRQIPVRLFQIAIQPIIPISARPVRRDEGGRIHSRSHELHLSYSAE